MAYKNKFYVGSISTVLPRKCGIASYNQDMIESMIDDERVYDWGLYSIVRGRLKYPDKTKRHIEYNIRQDNLESWLRAGDSIIKKTKERQRRGILSGYFINHEFGIFGKDHTQDNLIPVLRRLHENGVPTITIFHTILANPDRQKREVTEGIIRYTDKIICLSPSGLKTLMEKYQNTPRTKLIFVPHGIPEIYIPETRSELKKRFGLEDRLGNLRIVFTSVGYLSPGKGLEYPIRGFWEVLKRYDKEKIVYLIAGETHPDILEKEGEEYRNSLIELTKKLGINGAIINKKSAVRDLEGRKLRDLKNSNIIFWNKHLTQEELLKVMKMSDVGIVGNLGREQISSGPGAYWIGSSRTTIATESPFFKDLENEGIGLLVRFESSDDFAERMLYYLHLSKEEIEQLEYAASDVGSKRTWDIIGKIKLNLMQKIVRHKAHLKNGD